VWIDQAVVRGGLAVFQCRLELGQAQRSVEVPQWMFDAASCHRMRLGPIPSVRWDVLRDLRALLSSRTQLADRDDLRDAQHRAEHGRGGADATITEPPACPSAVPVAPDVAVAAMGDLPARDPRAGTLIREVVVDVDAAAGEVILVIHWKGTAAAATRAE
jgi:hypothetical protein